MRARERMTHNRAEKRPDRHGDPPGARRGIIRRGTQRGYGIPPAKMSAAVRCTYSAHLAVLRELIVYQGFKGKGAWYV